MFKGIGILVALYTLIAVLTCEVYAKSGYRGKPSSARKPRVNFGQ